MKRKMIALLLVLAMLAALTACGGSASSGEASAVQESESTASQEEAAVQEDTPAQDPSLTEESASAEDAPAPEDQASAQEEPFEAPADAPAEEALHNDTVIEYPLANGETLSIFCAKPGGPPIVRDSWAEEEIFQNAEEYLGVHIEWNEADMFTMDTQFQLMIAAGDYDDIITGVVGSYSTGAVGAYDDGVIIDIADLVYDNMPNYWNWVHTDPEKEKYVTTEEGYELAVYVVNDQPLTERGLLLRSDWLEDQGLEVPQTFEELESALLAFKDSYGCSDPLYIGETGLAVPALTSGFGINYFDSGLALRVDDGKLVCSYMTDEYRDYVELMGKWLQEGLFDGDMVLNASFMNMNTSQTLICTDQVGAFHSSANQINTYYTYTENENFDLTPVNVITREPGGDTVNHFGSYEPVQSIQTVSVSTDCSNPELALRWIDYWYSEEGTMAMTYGVEGLTYELDDSGSAVFTDLIINNDEGMSPEGMIMKYNCQGKICGVMMQKALWNYYSDAQKELVDFWSSQVEYDRSVPGYVALNTAESQEYNAIISDIVSYAESELTKFIFGDRPMDQWDTFVGELEEMGIQDAVDIYQAAYDRQTA